jgi:SAM-dependent methyltransferase
MMDDYRITLENQRKNATQSPNVFYLQWLYGKIGLEFTESKNNLEVGAGAGISEVFLTDRSILKTDILSWEGNSVKGNIDAKNLPFQHNSFMNVLAVDMLHHTKSPIIVINECLRVLDKGGKMIIVEPYVSVFSYLIYKLFHHEETTWKLDLESVKLKNDKPFDGDQGISRTLFRTKKRISNLKETLNYEVSVEKQLISCVSFFATGGLTDPLKTPKYIMSVLVKFDSFLPQFILRFCASRILVVISKSESDSA